MSVKAGVAAAVFVLLLIVCSEAPDIVRWTVPYGVGGALFSVVFQEGR